MSGIDLLPWRTRRRVRRYRQGILLSSTLVLLLVLASHVWMAGQIVARQAANTRLSAQIIRGETSRQQLQGYAASWRRQDRVAAQRAWPGDWVRSLSATIPDAVRLVAWQAQNGCLELHGQTADASAVENYLAQLRSVRWWGSVALLDEVRQSKAGIEVLNFHLRIGPPAAAPESGCSGRVDT